MNFRRIAFFVVLSVAFAIEVSAQGVDFRDLTFNEALKQSAKEKKMVFLDCYTSWCGPCRYMLKNVFPTKKAGNYFNKRFVCIKMDMEKGEGIELAKKFNVRSYPNFLIFEPDGTLKHRVGGAAPLNELIAFIEAGISLPKSLEEYQTLFASGKIKKKDLTDYWMYLRSAGKIHDEHFCQVNGKLKGMLTSKDRLENVYWPLLSEDATQPDSEAFGFILDHFDALKKNCGDVKVSEFVFIVQCGAIDRLLTEPISDSQYEKYRLIMNIVSQRDWDKKEALLAACDLAKARLDKDFERFYGLLRNTYHSVHKETLFKALSGVGDIVPQADVKPYYARLSALADTILADAEMKSFHRDLKFLAADFKSKGQKGVYWYPCQTLNDAIMYAVVKNKPIFMDCYTQWCGPCKYMLNKVFVEEKIGDFLNEHFIPIKMDMEKGEGPELVKKFNVKGFPTFVILNPDGSVCHKFLGGGDADLIMKEVNKALSKEESLGAIERRYQAGDTDLNFLRKYMETLRMNKDEKAAEVADKIFSNLSEKERLSKTYWDLFADPMLSPRNSEIGNYLLSNKEALRSSIGREVVDKRIALPYETVFMHILGGTDNTTTASEINQMIKEFKPYKLVGEQYLIKLADAAKLVLAKELDAKKYRKVLSGLNAEGSLYLALYFRFKPLLSEVQNKEWEEWGSSINK